MKLLNKEIKRGQYNFSANNSIWKKSDMSSSNEDRIKKAINFACEMSQNSIVDNLEMSESRFLSNRGKITLGCWSFGETCGQR